MCVCVLIIIYIIYKAEKEIRPHRETAGLFSRLVEPVLISFSSHSLLFALFFQDTNVSNQEEEEQLDYN